MDENQAGPRKQQRESKKAFSPSFTHRTQSYIARTAASSPRNGLVKTCRVHPTHWLISTQVHCKAGHGRSAAVAYAWLVFADRGATSPRAVYAAFARKRNVRRGLWRQPNVAALAEQLALSDYKTPATRS